MGGFDAGAVVGRLDMNIQAWKSAVEKIKRDQVDLGSAVGKLSKGFINIGKTLAITGTAAAGAIGLLVKSVANAGDNINDLSQRTGIATEILSGYKLAAEKSGTSLDGFATGMKGLSLAMVNAASGGKEAGDAFKDVGVSATDSMGKIRPLDQVMLDVADRFALMENGAAKNALAMRLFGKAGMDLIPMLNMGRKGLEENYDITKKLGGLWSTEAAQQADAFNDALAELKQSFTGIKNDIGKALIPVLTELVSRVTSGMATMREKIAEFTQSEKFQQWVLAVARAFVTGFQVMAKAVEGLLLVIQFAQGVIFKFGEEFMRTFAEWGVRIFTLVDIMSKVVPGLKGIRDEIGHMVSSLVTVGMEYRELADMKFEAATDIASGFETLNGLLDKMKAGLGEAGREAKKAGSVISDSVSSAIKALGKIMETAIPPAKEMNLVMAMAPGAFDRAGDAASGLDLVFKAIGESIGASAAAVKIAMWNMAADVLAAYGIIIAKMPDFPAAAATATTQTETFFSGLYNDIAVGFGDCIASWGKDLLDFKSLFANVWDMIKQTFFTKIGQMVTGWLLDFITPAKKGVEEISKGVGKSLDGVGGKVKGLGATIGEFISGIGTGIGGFISGLATGIGAAVVSISTAIASAMVALATGIASAATIIAAAAPAIIVTSLLALGVMAGLNLLKKIFAGGSSGAGDGMGRVVERQDVQTGLLTMIRATLNDNIKPILWGMSTKLSTLKDKLVFFNTPVQQIRDHLKTIASKNYLKDVVGYLKQIEANTATGFASGGIAWTPQLARVAERKPEIIGNLDDYLAGRPLAGIPQSGGGGGQGRPLSVTVHVKPIVINKRDRYLIEFIQENLNHNALRVPVSAVGG